MPPQRQAGRAEWAGRAEQAGPRGYDWILLGHAEPIDPVVIKVAPKPDSYSTLGGRRFSEKHSLFPMVWHSMEQSLARVLPAPPSPLMVSVPKGDRALGVSGVQAAAPIRQYPGRCPWYHITSVENAD